MHRVTFHELTASRQVAAATPASNEPEDVLVMSLIMCLSAIASFLHAATGSIQSYYVDELFYDRYAMELAQWLVSSEPVKFSYVHPSGYSLVLAFIYGLYYLVGKALGQFPDLASFLVHFGTKRGDFIILGRFLSAAFAVATVPFLYALAGRLFNKRTAVLASLAFVTSYPVVFYAHIAANITMLMFLTAAAMYFVVRVAAEDSVKNYLFAGAFVGAAVGTKYYPILLTVPLLLAHFFRTGFKRGLTDPSNLRKLFAAASTIIVCTFITFPLPLLAFDQWTYFIKDTVAYYTNGNVLSNAFKLLWGSVPYYAETASEPSPWWSNSLRSWTEITLLWIGIGALYAAVRFPRKFLLLATPFLFMFVAQSTRGGLGLGVRQLYFAVPLLIVLAAGSFVTIIEGLRLSHKWRKVALIIGSVALLAQGVVWSVRYLVLLDNPTTVELGREWLLQNIPRGSVLLCDGSAAPFGETEDWWSGTMPQPFTRSGLERFVQQARMNSSPFKVIGMRWQNARVECENALQIGKPVYVVTTDYFFSHYWHPLTLDAWGNMRLSHAEKMRRYITEISSQSTPIHIIRPREVNSVGPTITISRMDSWDSR